MAPFTSFRVTGEREKSGRNRYRDVAAMLAEGRQANVKLSPLSGAKGTMLGMASLRSAQDDM